MLVETTSKGLPPGSKFLVVESSSARAPSGGRVDYNPARGATFCVVRGAKVCISA